MAAKEGYLNLLKWLVVERGLACRSVVSEAAGEGSHPTNQLLIPTGAHRDVLLWLEKKHLCQWSSACNGAAHTGNLELFLWMEGLDAGDLRKSFPSSPRKFRLAINDEIFEHAIKSGSVDLFNWLWMRCKYLIQPAPRWGNIAAEKGHLHLLKRLVNLKCAVRPRIVTTYASKYGQLEICKWLDQRGILDANSLSTAALLVGNLEIFKWGVEHLGIELTADMRKIASTDELLKYLNDLGCPYY